MIRASDQCYRTRGGAGSIPTWNSEISSVVPSPITKQPSLQSNNIIIYDVTEMDEIKLLTLQSKFNKQPHPM